MAAAPITSVQSNVSWSCSKTLSHDESWPCPRGGGSLTAVGSELILFGGASVDGRHFNDTWRFNPTKESWEELSLSGDLPRPRSGHSAILLDHENNNNIVIFGGQDASLETTFNDAFVLNVAERRWASLSDISTEFVAPALNSHVVGICSDGCTMVTVCGATPLGPCADIWNAEIGTNGAAPSRWIRWQKKTCIGQGPSKREMAACAMIGNGERIDPLGPKCSQGRMFFLHGGRDDKGHVLQDTYLLDTMTWTWTRLLDSPFSCCAHVAVQMFRMGSDSYDIVTFGGWNGGSTFKSDIWKVYISPQDRRGHDDTSSSKDNGCMWEKVDLKHKPEGRIGHCAATSNDTGSIVVFGGITQGGEVSDMLKIHPLISNI